MKSPRGCPRSFYLCAAHILELSPALLARDRPVDDDTTPSSSKKAHTLLARRGSRIPRPATGGT